MTGELRGARVLVMGLGRFGGGTGVTRWLASQGARVIVNDSADADTLREPIAEIADLVQSGAVELRLGGHDPRDFKSVDLVVANPAVKKPWQNECLLAAQGVGVPVTTEIRLVVERLNRDRVIGVTGSAGKSTTAAMIHHILVRLGRRAHLGGNIGGSLLPRTPFDPEDWIVLELSSAQLYWLGEGVGSAAAGGWSPRIAVITNVTPNHIDWHGSFEHYRASKMAITRHQQPGDRLLRGEDEAPVRPVPLQVPGAHNQRNAWLAARAVREYLGGSVDPALDALADFPGLPHRLQLVAEHDGVRFYNDSKSTTPEATCLAVEAFDEPSHIHLIVGGSDKGSDLSPISNLAPRLAGLHGIGATGRKIIDSVPPAARSRASYHETLERAVDRALDRAREGDIILLSPGCASFDQFANFEHRGEAFIQLVTRRAECA